MDEAVVALYRAEYRTMVGVARVLVGPGAAEEIVQEAFVRLIGKLSRLRDPHQAGGYLRTTVVNLCRGRLRRRAIGLRLLSSPSPSSFAPGPDDAAADRAHIAEALARLPLRQRECLVLRYYADMTEAETARTLGITVGSVKSHVHRALAAMERVLEVAR